jgi:hypothetical protein
MPPGFSKRGRPGALEGIGALATAGGAPREGAAAGGLSPPQERIDKEEATKQASSGAFRVFIGWGPYH